MDLTKLLNNLQHNHFETSYFESKGEAGTTVSPHRNIQFAKHLTAKHLKNIICPIVPIYEKPRPILNTLEAQRAIKIGDYY